MSNLLVASYEDQFKAAEVLTTLRRAQNPDLIDLDDAVYVIKNEHNHLTLHETVILTGVPTGRNRLGGLLSVLLFSPLIGLNGRGTVDCADPADPARLADFGITEEFAQDLGAHLCQPSSTLFVLVRRVLPEIIEAEVAQFGGYVMNTRLANDAEARLCEELRTANAITGGDGATSWSPLERESVA